MKNILVLCSGVDDAAGRVEIVAVAFVIVGVAVEVVIVVVDVDNVATAGDIVLLAAFCTLTSFVGF